MGFKTPMKKELVDAIAGLIGGDDKVRRYLKRNVPEVYEAAQQAVGRYYLAIEAASVMLDRLARVGWEVEMDADGRDVHAMTIMSRPKQDGEYYEEFVAIAEDGSVIVLGGGGGNNDDA